MSPVGPNGLCSTTVRPYGLHSVKTLARRAPCAVCGGARHERFPEYGERRALGRRRVPLCAGCKQTGAGSSVRPRSPCTRCGGPRDADTPGYRYGGTFFRSRICKRCYTGCMATSSPAGLPDPRRLRADNRGASPVVGVLLMLVIVVILAAAVFAGVRQYVIPDPPEWAASEGGDDTSTPDGVDESSPESAEEKWSVDPDLPGYECEPAPFGIRDYLCTRVEVE